VLRKAADLFRRLLFLGLVLNIWVGRDYNCVVLVCRLNVRLRLDNLFHCKLLTGDGLAMPTVTNHFSWTKAGLSLTSLVVTLVIFRGLSSGAPSTERERKLRTPPSSVAPKKICVFGGIKVRVSAISFNPVENSIAIAQENGTVSLYEANTGIKAFTLANSNSTKHLAFSRDGKMLALGGIELWNLKTRNMVCKLAGHKKKIVEEYLDYDGNRGSYVVKERRAAIITAIAFSPHSQFVASSSDDKTIEIWSVTSGKLLQTLKTGTSAVLSVAYADSGNVVAAGCRDNQIRLWDSSTGAVSRVIKTKVQDVTQLSFIGHSRLLSVMGLDGATIIVDTSTGKTISKLPFICAGPVAVYSLDGERFAKINTAGANNVATVSDSRTGAIVAKFNTVKPDAIALSKDGRFLAVSGVNYNHKYENGYRIVVEVWRIP
jgi:WD40 repeat protein